MNASALHLVPHARRRFEIVGGSMVPYRAGGRGRWRALARHAAIDQVGGQVATEKTPLTYGQALGAVQAALPSGTNWTAVTLIAAQSAVETAAWQSMHNWNFGNVTPTGTQAITGDWMDQGLPMKYISYPDPVSGAKGMIGWLQGHGLLDAAEAGDLDSYMSGLRAGCYLGCIGLTDPTGHTVSQDDYDNYRAGIASWMSKLQDVAPETPPGGGTALWKKIAAVGGGMAAAAGAFFIFDEYGDDVMRSIRRL